MCVPKRFGGLGFSKVREFNLAMLSKQGWRLVKHPDSLVTRVLKARYYPKSSFLDAKLGSSSSFVWRSIWQSQEVLKKGHCWRVGDGKDI